MVLYILLILMTNKNYITYWLVAICAIVVIFLMWYGLTSTEAKKELSDYDVCYGSGSTFEAQVTACWNVIKKEQRSYPRQEEKLKAIAESADNARNQISKITNDFFSKNLSWTNVDFIQPK